MEIINVSTANGKFFVTSSGTVVAKNIAISGNSTFAGSLSGATGTFSGALSGATGTFSGNLSGATVTGGLIRTSSGTGSRVEIQNGGYLIWAGSGVKNDANATFYIKSTGEAFFGGSLSAGVISNSVRSSILGLNPSVEIGTIFYKW